MHQSSADTPDWIRPPSGVRGLAFAEPMSEVSKNLLSELTLFGHRLGHKLLSELVSLSVDLWVYIQSFEAHLRVIVPSVDVHHVISWITVGLLLFHACSTYFLFEYKTLFLCWKLKMIVLVSWPEVFSMHTWRPRQSWQRPGRARIRSPPRRSRVSSQPRTSWKLVSRNHLINVNLWKTSYNAIRTAEHFCQTLMASLG